MLLVERSWEKKKDNKLGRNGVFKLLKIAYRSYFARLANSLTRIAWSQILNYNLNINFQFGLFIKTFLFWFRDLVFHVLDSHPTPQLVWTNWSRRLVNSKKSSNSSWNLTNHLVCLKWNCVWDSFEKDGSTTWY